MAARRTHDEIVRLISEVEEKHFASQSTFPGQGFPNASVVRAGNRAEYLIVRLIESHPEILDRLKRGEFKSVFAAAIEAGIAKPVVWMPTKDATAATEAVVKRFGISPVREALRALCGLQDSDIA